jgi:RimJ/RimL family protein N-acetyltransferase
MIVLETERLVLRRLTADDAAFILELLNEPSFLRFIGDRGVRSLDDARRYIETGPMAMYAEHGFGMFLTELKEDAVPIGICGLMKREALPDVDVGFAFLPRFWSRGYALESATAVVELGRRAFGLKRITGITKPDNRSSIKVLERLGLTFEKLVKLSAAGEDTALYAREL